MEFLSQAEIPKIGTSITFDFIMIVSMVLIIVLFIIIMTVIVLFELNWIVEYLLHLCSRITSGRVTIDKIKIMTCFMIGYIVVVDQTEWIIKDQQKARQNSQVKTIITIEQLSFNINCNTTDKDSHHVTCEHVPIFEFQFEQV